MIAEGTARSNSSLGWLVGVDSSSTGFCTAWALNFAAPALKVQCSYLRLSSDLVPEGSVGV